jgi:tetratricopeptide (TPR) repeat protein
VTLADFGISSWLAEVGVVTCTGQALGTCAYAAPEQQARLPVDERADQFSLAVIAYELLTGRRPLGDFKPPSRMNPLLSPEADGVLLRALQEDPDDRYPTVGQFAEALDRALAVRPPRPRRLLFAGALAATALMALVGVGAAVYRVAAPGRATTSSPSATPAEGPQPSPALAGHQRDGAAGKAPGKDLNPPPAGLSAREAAELAGHVRQAREDQEKGHHGQALAHLNEAIRLSPRDPSLLVRRGIVYSQLQKNQEAIADFTGAILIDPGHARAYHYRGWVLLQFENKAKAVADFSEAVRLEPKNAEFLLGRGWVYHNLGKHDLAIKDLDVAVQLTPASGPTYHTRGMARQAKGDYAGALDDFGQAASLDPTSALCHASLAELLATCPQAGLRDGKRALEHARRANELAEGKSWGCLRVLAAAHAEAGEWAAAARSCEEALKLAPPSEQTGLRDRLAEYRKRAAEGGSS